MLKAASDAIRAKGVHASLDDIARQAGVSKGGLIYHFASKDDLVLELARDLLASFRTSIEAQLDPADTGPGRLVRAYIRAMLQPAEDEAAAWEAMRLITQLMTVPAVARLVTQDTIEWRRLLAADGLPDDVLALVIAAADGVNTAPLWGAFPNGETYRRLEIHLIEFTHHPELWEDLPWPNA